ncbi:hypothetical protein [Kitasatospora sp. McL0602]|uniref:hypothetical protein n=1 Tax=Kitasatospora sp. McL0602 TaxID=3439530 RepID=UPI003F89E676
MIYFNLPGTKEVLVFGDRVVKTTDKCYELGGQGRHGSCGDLAHSEVRHVDGDTGSIVSGCVFIAFSIGLTILALTSRAKKPPVTPTGP